MYHPKTRHYRLYQYHFKLDAGEFIHRLKHLYSCVVGTMSFHLYGLQTLANTAQCYDVQQVNQSACANMNTNVLQITETRTHIYENALTYAHPCFRGLMKREVDTRGIQNT